jgi:diaminopimelate decarboxylase
MKRLELFPLGTTIHEDVLTIAGIPLTSLAKEHGTPLYVYDRATLDHKLGEYQSTLAAHYPARASITYAGKAFLCTAIARWARARELTVDCTGEGEIAIAGAAGLPREQLLVHGVNKSTDDLISALQNAGTIVVDNLTELKRIHVILSEAKNPHLPKRDSSVAALPQSDISLWLRLLPGVAVVTHHAHTQTGQLDSKFGMTREEIREAVMFCRENGLPVSGLHFHQGSNFRDPEPLIPAIELALEIAREIGFSGEWHFCPGGGWGIAYHEDELPNPSIEGYVRGISEAVVEGCRSRDLELPHLHLEPGRSLIAQSGVAIYRVGAVKNRGDRTWLLIDGGMADNPRHAMYGARYSCLPVTHPDRAKPVRTSIGGPFCESGDVLIEDLLMPEVQVGEWIAIPVSGAYQLSMASNYNGARRPAVIMLENGSSHLIQRRELTEDLLRREDLSD